MHSHDGSMARHDTRKHRHGQYMYSSTLGAYMLYLAYRTSCVSRCKQPQCTTSDDGCTYCQTTSFMHHKKHWAALEILDELLHSVETERSLVRHTGYLYTCKACSQHDRKCYLCGMRPPKKEVCANILFSRMHGKQFCGGFLVAFL